MLSFRQFLTEVLTFKNNQSWVLGPGKEFQIKDSGAVEHPDLFPHLNFMGRRTKTGVSAERKPRALSWGRIDHDNKLIHIITQNGGLSPGTQLSGKRLEDDVFARFDALSHLQRHFPDYRIHYGGAGVFGDPDQIQTHSHDEHGKHLMSLLRD